MKANHHPTTAVQDRTADDRQLSPPGYETSEPNLLVVGIVSLGIVVALIVVIFFVQSIYKRAYARQVEEKILTPVIKPYRELQAWEEKELHSYGVLDVEKGQVRLPVERAMEVFLSEAGNGQLFYPAQDRPTPEAQFGVDLESLDLENVENIEELEKALAEGTGELLP